MSPAYWIAFRPRARGLATKARNHACSSEQPSALCARNRSAAQHSGPCYCPANRPSRPSRNGWCSRELAAAPFNGSGPPASVPTLCRAAPKRIEASIHTLRTPVEPARTTAGVRHVNSTASPQIDLTLSTTRAHPTADYVKALLTTRRVWLQRHNHSGTRSTDKGRGAPAGGNSTASPSAREGKFRLHETDSEERRGCSVAMGAIAFGQISPYTNRDCSIAAAMKLLKSGWGSNGRDFSSGWN